MDCYLPSSKIRLSLITCMCYIILLRDANGETTFNTTLFAVNFDPYVSVTDIGVVTNYDINGLLPMIFKISTRFAKIMVTISDEDFQLSTSRMLTPSAVATFNKFYKNPNQPAMEDLADKANSIYPGTVKMVFLIYDSSNAPLERILDKLSVAETSMHNSSYELGVGLGADFCSSSSESQTKFVKQIFRFVGNHVKIYLQTVNTLLNGQEEAQKIITSFKICKAKVKKLKSVTVGLLAGYHYQYNIDDYNDNIDGMRQLVTFWRKIGKFSAETNTTVTLFDAFDLPFRGSARFKGWWKLVENVTYCNSSQYVFQEKVTIIENEILITSSTNHNGLNFNETSFSPLHFGVYFDPYVSAKDADFFQRYDVTGLLPMISKVSSRFNKVMASMPENVEEKSSQSLIPYALAHYNKVLRDSKQNPMELLINLQVCNGLLTNSYFDSVKSVADKTNQIFKGTVKHLYFYITDQNVEKCLNNLEYVHSILNSSDYKLGAYLDSSACYWPAETFMGFITSVLKYAKSVMFRSWKKSYMFISPEDAVILVATRFQKCKSKIANYSTDIPIGLATSWEYLDNQKIENVQQLVQYWVNMNEFALKENTTVIMLEAFDVPSAKLTPYRGWWRLVENDSYRNPSDHIFEERATLLRRDFPLNPSQTGPNDVEKSGIQTLAITGVALLLLAVLIVGSILLYRSYSTANAPLTDKDIAEFYDGSAPSCETDISDIYFRAYNQQLEFMENSFKIELESPLGSGAFATVYKGCIYKEFDSCKTELPVAVKTTKQPCPNTAIKGLLSEIKVLSYLGAHENIVSIIGAYTKKLRAGKLYVFLELCGLGSLEKHLRENIERENLSQAVTCEDHVDNIGPQYENLSASIKPGQSTEQYGNLSASADLYRWSTEIVNGMEYLASKNVVHADLATRNVLLTSDKTAKISDFGLSRRLYEYTNYVKTQQEPLPWRWMAPESLRRIEFNEKTDVWAFGITLWEIYSLGDVPYEGLSWTPSFSSQLATGLRLPEPRFNEHGIYSTMLRCWNVDPARRPTFSELKMIVK